MQKFDKTLDSQERLFDIYLAYKKIGSCVFCIESHQIVNRTQQPVFPNSWFSDRKSRRVFPFLKITGLKIEEQKRQGNGRLCLQALFEYSQRSGCNGRMALNTAFGSAPFYEHCGFKGGEIGQDGFKCFEPTAQSLSLLYKDSTQEEKFKLIPASVPNSVVDKDLFDSMMAKARNTRQRS